MNTVTDVVKAPATNPERFRPLIKVVTDSVASASTKWRYAKKIAVFLAWWEATGERPLSRQLVQEYLQGMRDEKFHDYELVHSLTAIKRLVREAAFAGHLDAIALEGIMAIKGPKVTGIRSKHWLTEPQMQRLMALPDRSTLAGKRDVVLFGLLLYCGLRKFEARALRFEHVKVVDGRPVIANLVGKGNKVRTIPMPVWLFQAIQEWVDAAGLSEGYILRGIPGSTRSFVNDEQICLVTIWNTVKSYAKKLGVKDLKPHDLRGTFGRVARANGADLDQIQQSYGHSSVVTTQQYIGANLDFQNPPCDALPVPDAFVGCNPLIG